MKALLRFLGMLALAVAVVIVAGVLVIYTGAYDVSARSGHTKIVGTLANTLMVRSVRAHARDIVSPVGMDFRNPTVLAKAAEHYDAMCRTCHGAPGKKPDPWELYPAAPDLVDALREHQWTDSEVFWIMKNGIKDTAMSAFGGSHTDDELWGLTALVSQLSNITPEQYEKLSERGQAEGKQHEHREPGGQTQSQSPAAPSGAQQPESHQHQHQH